MPEHHSPRGKGYRDYQKRYRDRKREEKKAAELECVKQWLPRPRNNNRYDNR